MSETSETFVLNLFASTNLQKLIGRDGGDPALPSFRPGDTYSFFLRTFDSSSGTQVETWPNIRGLSATIGKTAEPPTAGEFSLRKGAEGVPFGPFTLATTEAEMLAAFNAAGLGFECVEVELVPDDDAAEEGATIKGLWNLRFDNNEAIGDIEAAVNGLRPESFIHWRPFQVGDVWWHELMLVVAPLAAKEDDHARVLAPAPSVSRIRAGGDPGGTSDVDVNEIQELLVPVIGYTTPFNGAFALQWGGRESKILTQQDGPVQIEEALNGMWADRLKRFKATLSGDNKCWIEFTGPLRDAAHTLITVSVKEFKPGTLNFTIPCTRAPMYSAMRRTKQLKSVLEIEFEVLPDDADPEDLEVVGRVITFQQEVTIVREGIPNWMSTVRTIQWLRPPERTSYRKVSTTTVLIGQMPTVLAAIGDGEQRIFTVDHNLGQGLGCHALIENAPNGRFLTPSEYTLRLGNDPDNGLILSFPAELDPPSLNQYVFVFMVAGPGSAFAPGITVNLAQVDGLDEALALLQSRITELEDKSPSAPFALPENRTTQQERVIILPDFTETFPLATVKNPSLLPAFHVDSFVVIDTEAEIPDPADGIGTVLQNGTGASLRLSLPRGWKTSKLKADLVPDGAYIGSDGRRWYRVNNAAGTNSYFPAIAEKVLWERPINAKLLRAGGSLRYDGKLTLATLNATSAVAFVLVMEVGTTPSQGTPDPTDPNLENVVWNTETPMFKQRLVFNAVAEDTPLGATILRDANGEFSASVSFYGVSEIAAVAPANADFALRLRLIEADTENSVANATGSIVVKHTGGRIAIRLPV